MTLRGAGRPAAARRSVPFANDGDYRSPSREPTTRATPPDHAQLPRRPHGPGDRAAGRRLRAPPRFTPTSPSRRPTGLRPAARRRRVRRVRALSGLAAGSTARGPRRRRRQRDDGHFTWTRRRRSHHRRAGQNEIIRTGSARSRSPPATVAARARCGLDGGFGPCTSATRTCFGARRGCARLRAARADAAGNTATAPRLRGQRPPPGRHHRARRGRGGQGNRATFRSTSPAAAQCSLDSETAFGRARRATRTG